MIDHQTAPSTDYEQHAAGLRFALLPVRGESIAVATVACMLDDGSGVASRILAPEEQVPYGAQPVLVAETSVYAAIWAEQLLFSWPMQLPRPWLVLVADVPARAPAAVRFRVRALQQRVAGTAWIRYLPSLRSAEGPVDAMRNKDVQRAAAKLRRHMGGK
ncbi:hypothetical protein ACFYMO_28260 [Streptomyces sp. NPDC007025]|uniref:hypothetical protein n=1 Tax=Streptomyces sp. NPDC007025 TaxID=3364771 RepID=UPI003679D989